MTTSIRLVPNRRYPAIPAITSELQNHTQALMALKEAVEVGKRDTADVLNSYVRVKDLVDMGYTRLESGVLVPESVSADDVSYDPSSSGLYGDTVQEAIDELAASSGASADDQIASEVPYTNTTSGLTGTNVQSAIDQLAQGYVPDHAALLSTAIIALSPLAYYKLNEASGNFADSSGNGRTLTVAGTPTYRRAGLLRGSSERYVWLDDAAAGGTRTDKGGLTTPVDGDFTCVVIALLPTASSSGPVRFMELGASGETSSANFNAYCRLLANGNISMFWESGAGVDFNVDSVLTLMAPSGRPRMLFFVKDGTANTVTFWVDGVPVDVVSYSTEPTDGSTTTLSVGVGSPSVAMGHLAYWQSKLTDAQLINLATVAGFLH